MSQPSMVWVAPATMFRLLRFNSARKWRRSPEGELRPCSGPGVLAGDKPEVSGGSSGGDSHARPDIRIFGDHPDAGGVELEGIGPDRRLFGRDRYRDAVEVFSAMVRSRPSIRPLT